MAAGNKKKKKPSSNPARGFATTSTQSKSKIEDDTDADAPAVTTPETSSAPVEEVESASLPRVSQNLQDLSPEELEAELEKSELQRFVETHASKVKKDASRHASRLQTDRRVLRSQADYLSVKQWLPEELMQEILDMICSDLEKEGQPSKKQILPIGDEMVARVWNLRLVLLELGIPLPRIVEMIAYLLQSSLAEDSTLQVWGLSEALDWLALNCMPDELLEYDSLKEYAVRESDDDWNDVGSDPRQNSTERIPAKRDSPLWRPGKESDRSPASDDLDVSEIDSDLEPDELTGLYLRTKETLYKIDENLLAETESTKAKKSLSKTANTHGLGVRKLQQKMRMIESDALFDQREADTQWALKKITLARNTAQCKRLDLPKITDSEAQTAANADTVRDTESKNVLENAKEIGEQFSIEPEDSEDVGLLGAMFDSPPSFSDLGPEKNQNLDVVTIRDFGRTTGMSPRRILEETCRSRDPRCKILYKQVSPTTYSCRHSVLVEWTRAQEILESSYMKSIDVKSKPRQTTFTMIWVATPDVAQSESYVATAALFLMFSGSPKEEKAHLRLPPAFRELWHEFFELKREHIDAADRETIKDLRRLIESQAQGEDAHDEEVVFSATSRRLNGLTSGISTPTSRPQTPRLGESEASQALRDMWAKKASTESYQRMLTSRMDLPMFHAKEMALEAIEKNQVTIIVGDTGSGKSTQVPQFILEYELSQGRKCKIYCTEPRRISAISLAQRVSLELGESRNDIGTSRSLLGYAIRLESQTVPQTKLVYATVGIVLRMLENSDGLNDISHLILDEVHERNIDTDFLLIVLRSLMQKRPDLKVVLMSATIDAQKFSQYLNGAPIITVPGRTFPVKALFLEDAIELTGHSTDDATVDVEHDDEDVDSDLQLQSKASQSLTGYSDRTKNVLSTYDEYKIDHVLIVKLLEAVAYQEDYKAFSGAILVFVPGIEQIRTIHDILLGHPSFSRGWVIYALHSTFSSEDQQAAFDIPPPGTRKIVIATNIAETGITIPDITCVIDTGKHREMRFDERRQMSRLTQSFIAKANAKQRRGRAGRVQEGICFHLFTKSRFEEMPEQQTPEMLRLSLQDLVMRVKICRLGDIEDALAQALDPPSSKNIRRAIDALIEVGALTANEQLTSLGSQLAKLPLDAQLGKLVLYGACFGCLDFTLTVAATISSKTPFLSPLHAKKQAGTVRLGFKRGDSDLLTLFNAYKAWRNVCNTRGISEYQFCNKNFLSPQNLGNIEDLKRQLFISIVDAGFLGPDANSLAASTRPRPGNKQRTFVSIPEKYSTADDDDLIASSVVAWSFFPKIIKRDGNGWKNIANAQSLSLHPTSINKTGLPTDVKYLSFYSIMQSSSKFTNAQETTPVLDFALVLLAGEAVFHMYAGVIVIDGNRLRFKVKDWKTLIVLKTLREKLREALGRKLKYPGRELGHRHKQWMELIEKIFRQRTA